MPDCVYCDETAGESLNKINEFLLSWVKADTGRPSDQPMRHLMISLVGPLPESECAVDRRTPEQKLAEAVLPRDRFSLLGRAAKSRFKAGEFGEAREHILELQKLLPKFKRDPHYNGMAHTVQIVLGHLALQEGDIEDAKQHLIEAGRSGTSPVLKSFGPNMSLASDLLLAGEKQAVLDYFEACSKFWEMGAEQLEVWEMYVNAARMPDFGANLDY